MVRSAIRPYGLMNSCQCGRGFITISDSTGIPPKYAAPAGFTQQAYGRYEASFLDASEEHNKAFQALWAKPAGTLSFRYGYLDKIGHFHMLITTRSEKAPAIPAAGAAPAPVMR